jgi:hypothetical protein
MARASYARAVQWIALEDGSVNDELHGLDWRTHERVDHETAMEAVASLLTVVMVADLWGKDPATVAKDVVSFTRRHA